MMSFSDLECARQSEQKRLDSLKSGEERNRAGQFATPFALASEIVRYVKTLRSSLEGPVRFLEPSLGTGAFYSALLHVFGSDEVAEAVGVEIDPHFVKAARLLWQQTGLQIVEGDFTALTPAHNRFNLILANPPYVRHHHLLAQQKVWLQQSVRATTGYSLHGLAGLYCYFVLLADRWLAEDGLAVWLIPSEFMDVNYGAVLRRYLTERATLLRIHRARPHELQFGDALVSSSVVIYRKTTPSPDHEVKFSLGGSLSEPDVKQSAPLEKLRKHRKWTQLPSPTGKHAPPSALASVCFGDLFEIKRGIATGANDFFILTRAEALSKRLPDQFLKPLLPSPRYIHESIIADDGNGFPVLPKQYVLLDCPLPPEQVRVSFPALDAYFTEGQMRGLDRRYLASKRTPWYRQEQRPVAPFLCTYMGRDLKTRGPFRFLWNQSQAVAANVYLLMYPTQPLAQKLKANPELYAEVFSRLLAVDFASLIGEGRVYGGALHKIEPRELSRAPLLGFEKLVQPTRQFSLF